MENNENNENNQYKWYIINVMAGQESKIASEIKSMAAQGVFEENVQDAIVPSQQVLKVKRGKKVQDSQKLFPGYVFVHANINSDAYSALNGIPKVLGFLGSKNKPEEVSQEKMDKILVCTQDQQTDNSNVLFEVGEVLNVIEGPFESFSGAVEEFDADKRKVKISILIFGRSTSVELELNQVEKA